LNAPKRVLGVRGDVARLDDLDRLFAAVKERFGGSMRSSPTAGVARFAPLEGSGRGLLRLPVRRQREGPLFHGEEALLLMSKGGTIVLNSSVANASGMATTSVYAATRPPSAPSRAPWL
jgi:NAD(P)-dependent dehydrogenase (short-subunit alcohol dehydrogenase family)